MRTRIYTVRQMFCVVFLACCFTVFLMGGTGDMAKAQPPVKSDGVEFESDFWGEEPNFDNYEVSADDEGNVYINGILVQDGDILENGQEISITEIEDEDCGEVSDEGYEPFTLDISFVDTETAVTFLPTEEDTETQRKIAHGEVVSRDSGTTSTTLPEDGRVELSIQISPGKEAQAEVPLRFGLELREGMYADLLVWDSERQQFADILMVYDVGPELEKSVALTLLLPSELIERLKGNIDTSETFKIVSWMEDTPDIKVGVSDLMVVELSEHFTSEREKRSSKWSKSKSFCKNFSNSMFGATVHGDSVTTFSSGGGSADVKTQVNADVDICVLGKRFNFLSGEGKAKANATNHLPERDCQDSLLKHRGKILWSYFGCKGDRNRPAFSVDVEAQMWVTILIIPVKFEAGAHGEIGIFVECEKKLSFPSSHLYYKAGPYVDTSAYASAAVSYYIAWAGIKGTLSPVIKDEFWGELSCSMELRNGGRDVWGGVSFRVGNDLYGPHGKLGPYAGYRYPSICKKKVCVGFWIFKKCFKVPWPCIKKKEKWWVVVDWNSFQRNDILLDVNESMTIRLPVAVPTSVPIR